jgi:hypothetical protein
MPLPTRGPATGSVGRVNELTTQVSASTNCANPGDTVDIILNIHNTSDTVTTLTGNPLVEMVIQSPFYPDIPKQYWSKNPDYSSTINPLLQPREERSYHWRWKADARYAPGIASKNGVVLESYVLAQVDGLSTPVELKSAVLIGVKSYSTGQGVGHVTILCRDMK